jgi:hypothetical protein
MRPFVVVPAATYQVTNRPQIENLADIYFARWTSPQAMRDMLTWQAHLAGRLGKSSAFKRRSSVPASSFDRSSEGCTNHINLLEKSCRPGHRLCHYIQTLNQVLRSLIQDLQMLNQKVK